MSVNLSRKYTLAPQNGDFAPFFAYIYSIVVGMLTRSAEKAAFLSLSPYNAQKRHTVRYAFFV